MATEVVIQPATSTATAPQHAAAPAKHNKFIGFLDAFGGGIAKIFKFSTDFAAKEEPVIDAALTLSGNAAVAQLFNTTVGVAQMAEAAASQAGAGKAGAAKSAAVVTAIMPSVQQIEQQFGVQIDAQKWNDAVVLAMKAITVAVQPVAS